MINVGNLYSSEPAFVIILFDIALAAMGVATLVSIVYLHRHNARNENLQKKLFAQWRPLILGFLDHSSIDPALISAAKKHPYWLLELITRMALVLRGNTYERLQTLLYETGLTSWLRRRLNSRRKLHAAEAARTLAVFHDIQARPRLRELVWAEEPSLAFASALALARIADDDDIELLFKMLAGFCNSHQDLVLLVLIACAEGDTDRFTRILRSKGTDNAELMALILEVLGHAQIPDVEDILETQLQLSTFDERHLRALRTAGDLRSESLLCYVREDLKSQRWEARAIAAWSTGRMLDMQSVPTLLNLLADSEWSVRLNAASALANLGETGKRALHNASETAADPFARDAATFALDRKLKAVPIL